MWRGTLLNELINLPLYWWKVFGVDTSKQLVGKYVFGEHTRQYYLWARPQEVSKKRIVIYLHGGGWWLGKPEQFVQNAQFFTSLGYSVFLPSYRRVPKYNIQSIREDLIQALRAIGANHYSDEIPEVILAGMSAGGHLAALLALDKNLFAEAKWPHGQIKGLISWCGPLDLDNTDSSLPQYWLLRNLAEEQKELANPGALIKKDQAKYPIVIFHGTKDGMINNKSADSFLATSHAQNLELYQCILPNTHLEIATWSIPNSKFWNLSRTLLLDKGLI